MNAMEACLITTAAQVTRFVSSGTYSDAAPAAHVGSHRETAQPLIEKPTGSSTGAFRKLANRNMTLFNGIITKCMFAAMNVRLVHVPLQ